MTLVVKVLLQNASILVGDSVVSGPETDREIFLPTIGNNIIVGWYGNYYAARTIIRELRKLNSENQISITNINNFLTNENIRSLVGNSVFENDNLVGITGFILESGVTHPFEYNSIESHTSHINLLHNLGSVSIYGTGTHDFQDYLTRNLTQISDNFSAVGDLSQKIHKFFLGISSHFLAKEILSGKTLLNFYGGYFDFYAFIEGHLLEKEDYTYFFWEVVSDNDGNSEAKLCFQGMRSRHLTEHLTECLSWIAPQSNDDNNASNARIDASLHYFSPIDKCQNEFNSLPLIQVNELNFNSNYSCHLIVFRDPDGGSRKNISWIKYAEPKLEDHPVHIENLGRRLRYDIRNQNFVTWIERKAQEIWNY